MNPIKIIGIISKIGSVLSPLFFAIVGGFVVSGLDRCSERQPVNLIVTNQVYENKLQQIKAVQDSILSTLPDSATAYKYLSDRYDRDGKGSENR